MTIIPSVNVTRWVRVTLALALLVGASAPALGLSERLMSGERLLGMRPALVLAARPALNLNTASAEELIELPGIGESKAAAILALRKERGGFRSVDELLDVKGIGPKALEKLRPHVKLGKASR